MTSNFDDPNSAHWYWGVNNSKPGTLITYFERDPTKTRHARIGAGQTHHFTFAISDEAEQAESRIKLSIEDYHVSPIMDRIYFKSIYTNNPDEQLIELTTTGPSFQVDEAIDKLDTQPMPPPWLSLERDKISQHLQPLNVPTWQPILEKHK